MDLTPYSLEGRVALVTGSARGGGQGIALTLARRGADVVVNDLAAEACQATVEGIESEGRKAYVAAADVSSEEQVVEMVRQAVAHFGRLDILVNNAAIGASKTPVIDLTAQQWDRVLNTNLRAYFLTSREAGRVMRDQGKGAIINIASVMAQNARQGSADYSAAKAGVVMLTKTMALEVGPQGIRVNAIAPGLIITDMSKFLFDDPSYVKQLRESHPLGRGAEPTEIGAAVAFLASDAASFVNGAVLQVSGGP